jgi:signal transduction histidine kinase
MDTGAARSTVTDCGPTATLAEVDILQQLATRPSRAPDYEAQNRALAILAEDIAHKPAKMLQRFVDVAVDLCHAGTAAITLVDGDAFRWEAVGGVYAAAQHGNMPRHASPCDVVIDRNTIQLMELPDRCFPAVPAEPRFVEVLLLPFQAQGDPVGVVWIVSHRFEQRFDREDARIVKLLAQYVSTAWQLWQQAKEARENNHRKDEFVATLSHELRNPFSAITTAVSILDKQISASDPTRRAVDVIGRQSRIVRRLVDDLLDVGRMVSGKLILRLQQVDLRTVVSEGVDLRRSLLAERQHELTLDLGTVAVIAEVDPVRVTQIVANLVDNAAKFTPKQGHIHVSLVAGDSHAAIVVKDDGDGIPPDRIHAVFEMFTQLRPSSGGLGLGLALVRRLAEMHGGSVHVASEGGGKGSRFTVRLPRPPDTPTI